MLIGAILNAVFALCSWMYLTNEDYECVVKVKVFWEVLNFHSVLWYPEFHFILRERVKGKWQMAKGKRSSTVPILTLKAYVIFLCILSLSP